MERNHPQNQTSSRSGAKKGLHAPLASTHLPHYGLGGIGQVPVPVPNATFSVASGEGGVTPLTV